jgi:hypothetical protein
MNIVADQFIQSSTYWAHKGRFEVLNQKLHALVPASGPVKDAAKNPKLELFRKASNVYYDLYNNGLGNDGPRAAFYRIFGFGFTQYEYMGRHRSYEYSPQLYERVEARINEIILEAGVEQGLI